MDPNYAYITLLSSQDYIIAVAALYESMQAVYTRYPLVIAYTPGSLPKVYKDLFEQRGLICKEVTQQVYPESMRSARQGERILNTVSKFSIFEIKDFEKMCYIDADTFLLKNIDDVFMYPDGSMMKEVPTNLEPGFDAFFVYQPAHHYTSYYMAILKENSGLDGEILGKCWYPVRTNSDYQIPREYCEFYRQAIWNFSEVKVVHFCNKQKPWLPEYKDSFDFSEPLLKLYGEYLQKAHIFLSDIKFFN